MWGVGGRGCGSEVDVEEVLSVSVLLKCCVLKQVHSEMARNNNYSNVNVCVSPIKKHILYINMHQFCQKKFLAKRFLKCFSQETFIYSKKNNNNNHKKSNFKNLNY